MVPKLHISLLDSSIAATVEGVKDFLQVHSDVRNEVSILFPAQLLTAWKALARNPPPLDLLTFDDHQSVHKLDEAYALCLGQVDEQVAHWRRRINSGIVIHTFGAEVAQFVERMQNLYMRSTFPTLMVRERSMRLKRLRDALRKPVSLLFERQVSLLRRRYTYNMRGQLVSDTEELTGSSLDGVLKEYISSFCVEVNCLTVDTLSIGNNDVITRSVSSFKKVIKELPALRARKMLSMHRRPHRYEINH